VEVAKSQTGPKDGIPAGMYFFLGSVALLSAAGDVRMLVRGGLFGVHRIARHLWRMCFSLFIATGSFFLGQQQVFPRWLRKTNVLFLPAILPLILLIFWLFRVLLTNAYKRKLGPSSGDIHGRRSHSASLWRGSA
jgi:cobalamin synthase